MVGNDIKDILRSTLGESYMKKNGFDKLIAEPKLNKYQKIVQGVKRKKDKRVMGENKKLRAAFEGVSALVRNQQTHK